MECNDIAPPLFANPNSECRLEVATMARIDKAPFSPNSETASPRHYPVDSNPHEQIDVLRYVNYLARRGQEEAENQRHDHSAYLVSLIQYWLAQQWGSAEVSKPVTPRPHRS